MKKHKKNSSKFNKFKGTKPVLIFSGIFIAVFAGSLLLFFLSDRNSASVINETVNSSPSNSVEINSSPAITDPVVNSTPVSQETTPASYDKQANPTQSNQESSQKSANQVSENNVDWKQKVNALLNEGYKKEEIDGSKQYVQGVMSNLNQIVSFSSSNSIIPQPGIEDDSSDDVSRYQDLSTKIDMDKAVYHMIKANSLLGGKEKVFDEYLISLQLDLDINELITDRAIYEKKKNEKLTGVDQGSLITADDITQKMLESIQKQNERNRSALTNQNRNNDNSLPGINNSPNNLPGIQAPSVPDPEAEIRKKLGQ
ncbi:MAG TPA: hypothetical protein PK566_00440 [Pseudobacteroides sp.]|nr:hypothetical protein [Pseudobacteroides sp.]